MRARDMERVLRMIFGPVVRQLMNKGIDAGVERATRGMGGQRGEPTAEQREQIRKSQRTARQAMRVARRVGRF